MTEASGAAWQQGAKDIFIWLDRFYVQCQALMDDAEKFFHDAGWKPKDRDGLGGVAYSSDLREWPFVYLKVIGAYPPGVGDETDNGSAALLGILFYDERRKGPACFGGAVRWSDRKALADHWMVNSVLTGYKDRYEVKDGAVKTALPNAEGKKRHPHIEEVRWFEVPLDSVSSPERLREFVSATMELVKGGESSALKMVTSSPSWKR